MQLYHKRGSGRGVFLWTFKNFPGFKKAAFKKHLHVTGSEIVILVSDKVLKIFCGCDKKLFTANSKWLLQSEQIDVTSSNRFNFITISTWQFLKA